MALFYDLYSDKPECDKDQEYAPTDANELALVMDIALAYAVNNDDYVGSDVDLDSDTDLGPKTKTIIVPKEDWAEEVTGGQSEDDDDDERETLMSLDEGELNNTVTTISSLSPCTRYSVSESTNLNINDMTGVVTNTTL